MNIFELDEIKKEQKKLKINKKYIVIAFLIIITAIVVVIKEPFAKDVIIKVPERMINQKVFNKYTATNIKFYKHGRDSFVEFRVNNTTDKTLNKTSAQAILITSQGKVVSKQEFDIPKIKKKGYNKIKIYFKSGEIKKAYNFLISN